MTHLFTQYGGWSKVLSRKTHPSILAAWQLPDSASASETLIQYRDIPYGRIRFVEIQGVPQMRMRPATKIWDTGGILDIDIRVHDIHQVFNDMSDRAWSGAAEPMPLPINGFVMDECLMSNADSMMIAFAKRHVPPLDLVAGKKFASHVYLSAMTVKNLTLSTQFYTEQLGFQLVNQNLTVEFPKNSPTNFGIPHNIADQYSLVLDLYSPDGTRDTMVECIETRGLVGNDFSSRCIPPNRGILEHRIEVAGIDAYLKFVKSKNVVETIPLSIQAWSGFGRLKCFTITSPDGARMTFFEPLD
jgi:catechol 2,3-dioxygenase-like lactoylglutathione lyase family enzyme